MSLPRLGPGCHYPLNMPANYPNRRNFEGVLTLIGSPSDVPPNGSRGHRIILTKEAVESALASLELAPVGFGNCWSIHNIRQRCGIITAGRIDGDKLRVRGHLFATDYPEVVTMMEKGALGMSYELADAHVADMSAKVWTITRFNFCGAAILYADKAAYKTTTISLSAAAELANKLQDTEGESDWMPFELNLINIVEGK